MEVFRFDQMIGLVGSYDALRPYLSTMYYLSDYDPLLYIQHIQYSPTTCSHAFFAPERIQYDVFARLTTLHVPNARRIQQLVSAAGVYSIRVTNVTSDTIKSFDGSGNVVRADVRTTVTAKVLDTIKGRRWLPGRSDPISSVEDGSGESEIRFSFDPALPYRRSASLSSAPALSDYAVQVKDMPPATYGGYQWSEGSEYIVFLQFGGYDNDGSFDYFAVKPQSQFDEQGGVYPIVDGAVQDENNFWGFGIDASVADFRSGLRRTISTILHGSDEGIFGAIGQR